MSARGITRRTFLGVMCAAPAVVAVRPSAVAPAVCACPPVPYTVPGWQAEQIMERIRSTYVDTNGSGVPAPDGRPR